jgi:outer membrane lipoprotein carrier protein
LHGSNSQRTGRGWHRRLLWGVALLAAAATSGVAQTAEDVLGSVRAKYETIQDAQLTFTQRSTFAGSRVEQFVSGTLLLKKKHMYRVELEGQTIVTDGKTVWSYSRPTNQVLIDLFHAETRGLTPERILTGDTEEYTATVLEHEAGGGELIALKLVPRPDRTAGGIIRLWVDAKSWLIRKAMLVDDGGKVTLYTVNDIRINTGIPSSRFVYEIPEGVEVVDLR